MRSKHFELEGEVADGEHLVDEQHLRVDVDGDREAEPHEHARRVELHRRVDELVELGEGDDVVEARLDLRLGEAEQHAVDVARSPGRSSPGGSPTPTLMSGATRPATVHAALGRPGDAGEQAAAASSCRRRCAR